MYAFAFGSNHHRLRMLQRETNRLSMGDSIMASNASTLLTPEIVDHFLQSTSMFGSRSFDGRPYHNNIPPRRLYARSKRGHAFNPPTQLRPLSQLCRLSLLGDETCSVFCFLFFKHKCNAAPYLCRLTSWVCGMARFSNTKKSQPRLCAHCPAVAEMHCVLVHQMHQAKPHDCWTLACSTDAYTQFPFQDHIRLRVKLTVQLRRQIEQHVHIYVYIYIYIFPQARKLRRCQSCTCPTHLLARRVVLATPQTCPHHFPSLVLPIPSFGHGAPPLSLHLHHSTKPCLWPPPTALRCVTSQFCNDIRLVEFACATRVRPNSRAHSNTVRPKNPSELIPAARKIEFESCK